MLWLREIYIYISLFIQKYIKKSQYETSFIIIQLYIHNGSHVIDIN